MHGGSGVITCWPSLVWQERGAGLGGHGRNPRSRRNGTTPRTPCLIPCHNRLHSFAGYLIFEMEGLHEAKPAPKKFVAPGSAGRMAKMAPTAYHAQQQREGESAKVQGATAQRPPGPSGEDGEERGRFIPRQTQSTRFYGASRGEGPDNQQPPSQRDHPPNQQRRTYYNPNQERRGHNREGADVPIRRPAPENPTIHKLARSYTFSVCPTCIIIPHYAKGFDRLHVRTTVPVCI